MIMTRLITCLIQSKREGNPMTTPTKTTTKAPGQYIQINDQKILVRVTTGKHGVYLCKRAGTVKPTDQLIDWASDYLTRNPRMLRNLQQGMTLYL